MTWIGRVGAKSVDLDFIDAITDAREPPSRGEVGVLADVSDLRGLARFVWLRLQEQGFSLQRIQRSSCLRAISLFPWEHWLASLIDKENPLTDLILVEELDS